MPDGSSCFAGCAELRVKLQGQRKRVHRFDRPTVLVTKTDLTYTVTLKTFCTLPSDNRQDAVDSQPLLRQPAAETERVGRVEIEMASRPWARTKAPPARIESSGIRGASSTQHSSTLFLCWPPLTRKSYLAASLGSCGSKTTGGFRYLQTPQERSRKKD